MTYYPIIKPDLMRDDPQKLLSESRPSLMMRHLQYTVATESSRAALTQHAMNNTAILMDIAGQIVDQNPASAGAMNQIMNAYLDATSDAIMRFGKNK